MNTSPHSPCRSCGKSGLELILSLGQTPLANALLSSEQLNHPEPKYPLDLAFCPHCTLVQITETVPPEKLFREYLYFSSFSDTVLENARQIAHRLTAELQLNQSSLVVEIASNDGYLLQYYQQQGIPVLGIEPAANIARVAREQRGINTICEFFGEKLAISLRNQDQQADLIHAHNVLAHVPDLNGFVAGISQLLKPRGIAIIEVPYIKDLIYNVEFDTIYHEHLCYFSLTALDRLFQRHGLSIINVEKLPIHGGSLRIFAGQQGAASEVVEQILQDESQWGVDLLEFYQKFAADVEQLRRQLLEILRQLKTQNQRLAAYGASAKGSTLLNYFGIGQETIDFVVDRSTVKQGLYTPGTHLPIYPPEKLLKIMPEYVLMLTWNFADEILSQQAEYRQLGGKFIIPIPKLKII